MGKGSRLKREREQDPIVQARGLLTRARQPVPNFIGPYFGSSSPLVAVRALSAAEFAAVTARAEVSNVPAALLARGALLLEVDLTEHPGGANMMLDNAAGLPVLKFTNAAHSGGNVMLILGVFRAKDAAEADAAEMYQNPNKVEVALDPVADRVAIEALLSHSTLVLRSVDHTGVAVLNGKPSIVQPSLVFPYDPVSPAEMLLALEPDLRGTAAQP